MRGSDFAELRAFAMVVEQGSFTRAAAHLGVTTSTLSATIRRLEERIGVRLLHRTTRSVAPSEAGKRMMQRLAPALAARFIIWRRCWADLCNAIPTLSWMLLPTML